MLVNAEGEAIGTASKLLVHGVDIVPGVLHGFLSLLGLSEAQAALSRGSEWLDTAFRAP